MEECEGVLNSRGLLSVGDVVVTGAHGLSDAGFERVLHICAPELAAPRAEQSMHSVICHLLHVAGRLGVESLALPMIGAGIFGWSRDLPGLVRVLIGCLADWARHSTGCPRSIVFMDTNLDAVQALAQAMRSFDDMPRPAASIESRPVFQQPVMPKHCWMYDCTSEGKGWVPYDYDQALQLDHAFAKHEPVITVTGDREGKYSDSKKVEPGYDFARYDVDFRKSGPDHLAVQVNRASKFERKAWAPMALWDNIVHKVCILCFSVR